ncbi:competence protein ComEC [Amycolatopsis marina]|uniref:Competence protein ComEC n=1 Tax=Amycolatopsis marina TaxID=490629 RepID=A0A1I0ZP37_9PSEU|nr:ComEC/Rec2 family competence protein [Amycolatopsis marina]SFB27415.1 competence protein ComEC [Amycolatopsis marina]
MIDSGTRRADTSRAGPDLRLLPAACAVWLAALLGLLWGWWAALLCGSAAALLGALWLGRSVGEQRPGRSATAAAALAVCGVVAALLVTVQVARAQQDPLRVAAGQGAEVVLRAEVAERPRPVRSTGYAGQQGGSRSVLVVVRVESAMRAGAALTSRGRVLLIANAVHWSGLLPGQSFTVHCGLTQARPAELTVAVCFVRGPPGAVSGASWWQRGADRMRASLRRAASVLADEPAGLLPGLVVGDTSQLSVRVEQEFLDAGMSHLTAVSGANITVVCGAILLLLRAARVGPRLRAGAAGVALVGFVVLVGPEPTVLRAGVMGAVGLLALALGRDGSALPALAAAVVGLVLHDPGMAVNFGFALSVVATAGLVLVAPRWTERMRRRGVPAVVAAALAVPLAAFLVTAPIVAGMAGSLSAVAVAANVLAAPVVAPVTVLGVAVSVLAGPWPFGAGLLVRIAGPGVDWLILVARQAAAVPGAVVPWPSGWWGGLLAALTVATAVVALRYRPVRTGLAVALVVLLLVVVPVRVVAPTWPPSDWSVVACDVGQGDGVVLTTGERGRAVVVDTGPRPGPVDRCLDRLDVDRVPLIVLSHLHADHIGGLSSVFEGRAVGGIALGPGRTPDWAWREVADLAAEHQVPLLELATGDRFGWPGLDIEVIGPRYVPPTEAGADQDGTSINNSSVVAVATTEAGRVLLTGDIELTAQADLLAAETDLRAEILKIPHHGSRFSLPEFLGAVRARVALVSVGADNTYGHPSPRTLRVLTGDGTLVARTDTSGDTAVVPGETGPSVVRRGPGR